MNLSANAATCLGLLLFMATSVLLAFGHWHAAVVTGLVGGFMDGLDGLIASEQPDRGPFGGILDSICDRLGEIAALTGFASYYARLETADIAAILFCFGTLTGALMVSYVKARAEASGIPIKQGIFQRTERLLLLGVLATVGPQIAKWGFAVLTVLVYATVVQRLFIARRACAQQRQAAPSPQSEE